MSHDTKDIYFNFNTPIYNPKYIMSHDKLVGTTKHESTTKQETALKFVVQKSPHAQERTTPL